MKETVRRLTRAFSLLCITLGATLLSQCNDNPTTIGSEYLPQNVDFKTYTLQPSDFEIVSGIADVSNASSEGSTSVLVGRAEDGTVAHGLLAVTGTSPLLKGPTARTVTGATLRLRSYGYKYGVTTGAQGAFDVVVIDTIFDNKTQWNSGLVSRIESAPVLGSFTSAYPDSTIISINLDLEAARRFLSDYYKFDTLITSTSGRPDTIVQTRTLKTLALRAKSDGRSIISFVGSTFRDLPDSVKPTLRVSFADTTMDVAIGVSSWITEMPITSGQGKLAVAGGMPVRTFLRVKLDSIPAKATIHQARLMLSVDTTGSKYGSAGPTTFMVAYIGDQGSLLPTSYLLGTTRYLTAFRSALDSVRLGTRFEFISLAPMITSWLRSFRTTGSNAGNNGLILALNRTVTQRAELETGTVDRLAFHDFLATDSTLWPSLTIIYSTQTDAQ